MTLGVCAFALLKVVLDASAGGAPFDYLVAAILYVPLLLSFAERASLTSGPSGLYALAQSSGSIDRTFVVGWLKIGGYLSVATILTQAIAERIEQLIIGLLPTRSDQLLLAGLVVVLSLLNEWSGATSRWRSRTIIVWTGLGLLTFLLVRVGLREAENPIIDPIGRPDAHTLVFVAVMAAGLWSVDLLLSHRAQLRRPHKSTISTLLVTWIVTCIFGAMAAFALMREADVSVTERLLDFSNAENLDHVVGLGIGIVLCWSGLSRISAGGLRLRNAMIGDGFLPGLGSSASKPGQLMGILLALIAGTAVVLATRFPVLQLAGFAAVTFLWTTVLTLAPHVMTPRDEMSPRFRLPLHPLLPGFTVVGSFFLSWILLMATGWWPLLWLAFGLLYYLLRGRRRAALARHSEKTVGERSEPPPKIVYRVLVTGGDGELTESLIRTAAAVARSRGGELLVLQPLVIDERVASQTGQTLAEREWVKLDDLVEAALGDDPSCLPLVRLAPHSTTAILETVGEYQVDLIVLRAGRDEAGESVTVGVFIGTSRSILATAGEAPDHPEKILVTTGGGPHAPAALEAAVAIAGGEGRVSLATVTSPAASEEKALAILRKTFEAAGSPAGVDLRVVRADKLEPGILEAAREHDLLLVGAPVDQVLGKTVAHGLSIDLAFANPGPTFIVKRQEKTRRFWKRRLWDLLAKPLPALEVGERAKVFAQMRRSARADVDYYVLITLAATIAIAGLMLDSGAVIIGAMLVAPLMNPILAMAHGIVQGNWYMIRRGSISTFKGTAVAIGVSTAAAMLLPQAPPTAQILARSEPNLLDLVVAIAAGAAAAYGVSRSTVSAALPGVAIAVALVPPLCVVGWGLGQSRFDIAGGAMILFLTNLTAIVLVGALVFILLGFRPSSAERGAQLRRSIIAAVLAVLALGIPLGLTTVRTIRTNRIELQIERILARAESDDWDISKLSVVHQEGEYVVRGVVFHYGEPDPGGIEGFRRLLEARVGVPVAMRITVVRAELAGSKSIQAERVDPVVED